MSTKSVRAALKKLAKNCPDGTLLCLIPTSQANAVRLAAKENGETTDDVG